MIRNPSRAVFAVAVGLSITACNVGPEQAAEAPDATASVAQPILNGTTVDPEQSGHVQVFKPGTGCSGELINNEWIVTARHCVEKEWVNGQPVAHNPADISVFMGSQSAHGLQVALHPETKDVALVRLSTRFRMNNSQYGLLRGLSFVTPEQMNGQTVQCYGYGYNTQTSGYGTLRTASVPTRYFSYYEWEATPNSSQQLSFLGDSGSACLLNGNIVGTMSVTSYQNFSRYTAASYYRDWAFRTMSGVEGTVDSAGPTGINGWAFDAQIPNSPMTVEYRVGSASAGPAVANVYLVTTDQYRPDVNNAYGLTGNHGYSFQVPAQYYDGQPHTLWLFGRDAQGLYDRQLNGSGLSFTFSGAEGHVDEITADGYVRGWALDLNAKSTSIAVHYYVGGPWDSGAPGFQAQTDQTRPDVNSAYGASGTHGFRFAIPAQFHDGYPRNIYIYAIDADGRHNPLIDGRSYRVTLGTPDDDEPVCTTGSYCECTGLCQSLYSCRQACEF